MSTTDQHALREQVRSSYATAARSVGAGEGGCCAPGEIDAGEGFGLDLYGDEDRAGLPDAAGLASLGCGNPVAVAELREGETVLDLGSGGGIDVLLSARRVGPTGFAYGLDMTEEMLDLARATPRRRARPTSSSSRARSRRSRCPTPAST
jgi:arsenite methyltransferase